MSDQSPEQIAAGLIASLLRLPRVESPRQDGPLGEAGARLRALVAQWRQGLTSCRVYTISYEHNGETRRGLGMLREDAGKVVAKLEAELDAMRSAPVVSPPTLYETASPEHRAIVDRVMQRVQAARTKAQAIGGGRSPTQEDDSQRVWACGCYEDQGGYHLCLTHAKEAAAPVVTQEGEEPCR